MGWKVPPGATPVLDGSGNPTGYYDYNGTRIQTDASGNAIASFPSPAATHADAGGNTGLTAVGNAIEHPLSTIRGATDTLGITTPKPPDITQGDAYKRLTAAADQFNQDYGAANANAAASRGLDLDTISKLQAAANGQVPSAAASLLQKAADQNASLALGTAAANSGWNPGAALRMGLSASRLAGQSSAADIAAQRAKEEADARSQLAAATSARANADLAAKGGAASTYASTLAAPVAAQFQQQQLNNQAQASNQALLGTIIGAGGQVLAKSDETTKEAIRGGGAAAEDFLNSLNPKTFEYKPDAVGPLAPEGRRLGVMAQDLPAKDVAVGPDGKRYIDANVISDILAGMGQLKGHVDDIHRRLGGTVLGGPAEYAKGMEYMTAPRVDAAARGRAEGGMPAGARSERMDSTAAAEMLKALGF